MCARFRKCICCQCQLLLGLNSYWSIIVIIYFTILYLGLHGHFCLIEDTFFWLWIFISLSRKSYNPFPYLTFLTFTLMIFPILVIQHRIILRDLLCSCFFICRWRCLLIFLCISGLKLFPSLSPSSEYWMGVSMVLDNIGLLCMYLLLSPLTGFLVEVPLHSDSFYTLNFLRHFSPISLLRQFHAVSFQVLILHSLSSGLLFFFIQVLFSL